MYPPYAVTRMTGMIRSGLVDLSRFDIAEFGLDDVNEAVEHAAVNAGPLGMTVSALGCSRVWPGPAGCGRTAGPRHSRMP